MVTFANLGSVRLPSLKFVGLRVRKIRRICMSAVVGPVTLTFDLLTLKRVHGSPSMVPNISFWGLSVLDLGRGTGRTDRRTDRQTTAINA